MQTVQLSAITTAETDISNWYGTGNKAQTPEGLETTNSDGLTITVLHNSDGYHVVMIYDAPAEAGDNSRGGVEVTFSCNSGSCNVEYVNNGSGGSPLDLGWNNCCTGGFIVGPFTDSTTVCLDHAQLNNLDNGARYKDSGSEFSVATGEQLGNSQICVSIVI